MTGERDAVASLISLLPPHDPDPDKCRKVDGWILAVLWVMSVFSLRDASSFSCQLLALLVHWAHHSLIARKRPPEVSCQGLLSVFAGRGINVMSSNQHKPQLSTASGEFSVGFVTTGDAFTLQRAI